VLQAGTRCAEVAVAVRSRAERMLAVLRQARPRAERVALAVRQAPPKRPAFFAVGPAQRS
jgi:hypothetical protein